MLSWRTMKVASLLLAAVPLAAFAGEPVWDAVDSLKGEWTGEGTGEPGKGIGSFSFTRELQGKLLVRRNRAEYPAAKDRLAFVHEDWMVVYRDSGVVRATYYDSEDHVIQYSVSRDGPRIVFLSEASPNAPRYRLTYELSGASRVKIKFEIAPPGKPEEFRTYIEAAAFRR